MTGFDGLQIVLVLGVVTFLTPVLGGWMAQVFEGKNQVFNFGLRPVEKWIYRLIGVNETDEMSWRRYAQSLVFFHAAGFVILLALQLVQKFLPLNPQGLPAPSWHSAVNTTVSFITNTNWQSYAGETTLSYWTQMVGLTTQNFLSAAAGIAVLLVLIRGLSRRGTDRLGNFWVDMTRTTIYILLPLSAAMTLLLVSQGVVQNFRSADKITTLEGKEQVIAQGPAASQVAIKQLGSNGGGFYNANSSHPLENPTPFSNFVQMIALILIPASLTSMFGVMVNQRKQGWVLFSVMMALLSLSLSVSLWSEYRIHSDFSEVPMEGKETRFGVTNSVLWSTLTTASSNGSVNSMHSSLSPLSGGVALLNILLGEIVFGGVGSGLYGMLLFVLLTVFLSGLMVGRTPEYLGKKIEAREIQMTILGILIPSAVILLGAGISVVLPIALSSLSHPGPHGLTEILYAFASAAGNNGSAFGGLNTNTPYYNLVLAFAMLIGRFGVILPVLAIAGSMAKKKIAPPSVGTFQTDSVLFGLLLVGVVLIVGALTFFPTLALGPVMEHFLLLQGRRF